MRPEELRKRTRIFALDVMDLCDRLPKTPKIQEIAGQLRRAANSTAANYRAAGRGRSHAEFTAKIGTVLEEADESQHWLEVLSDLNVEDPKLPSLLGEAGELVAIFTASHRTALRRKGRRSNPRATPHEKPSGPASDPTGA
jgi:four helix bundle protein